MYVCMYVYMYVLNVCIPLPLAQSVLQINAYYNHGQNILDKLWFSCEIAQNWKILISIFQQFSASIKKIFSLGRSLGTGL